MMWIAGGLLLAIVPYVMATSTIAPQPQRHRNVDPAIIIDMVRSGLESGASIATTLLNVGHALGDKNLRHTASLLHEGFSWKDAWACSTQRYPQLCQALQSSWNDGVDPEPLLVSSAKKIRSQRQMRAQEAAEKLSVRLVIPLGLCQLPAFICLGIVPVISGGVNLTFNI